MGGEWSLGVALVMEIWPNRSRAFMAGLIGAAANAGYLLVGAVGLVLNTTSGQPGGVVDRCRHARGLDQLADLARGLAAIDDVRHGACAFDVLDSAVRAGIETLGTGTRPRRDQLLGHA